MGSACAHLCFLLFFHFTLVRRTPLFYRCDSGDLGSVTQGPPPGPLTLVPSLELGAGEPPTSWLSPVVSSPWLWLPLGAVQGGPCSGLQQREEDHPLNWSPTLGRTYWPGLEVGFFPSFPQRAGLLEADACHSGSFTV